MKKTLTTILSACLLLLAALTANAQQTMDVSKFTRMDNDLMARVTKPVRDKDEGKLCALIRVVTNLRGLGVRADALGIVQQEQHDGELWLYVPYGARSLSFTHEGHFPLLYQYPMPIEEGVVYELRLSTYATPDAAGQSATTQMFVLTHTPDAATVYIDDMEVPTENGVFAAMMSRGQHTYKVQAKQFEEAEGTFELGDQPLRETVKLHPLFGTFQLYTLPENDFDVFVNGRRVGLSPYKSDRLEPGSYRIRLEKKDYYPVDTLLRLREGDELELTCKLTSFADSLFYNRELGGRRLSLGVNVGYLMPFATSSAGGGFCGSPVNYSFGNATEDVSYTSQSGFTAGLMADYKLYKNFYLMAGVSFSQYKFKNTFSAPINGTIIRAVNSQAWKGDRTNSFKEEYTVANLEIPILASYRFVLTKTGSLHLNLGPVIYYGLSAKMDFSGSSEYAGTVYSYRAGRLEEAVSYGTFSGSDRYSADMDLYSKDFTIKMVGESGMNLGFEQKSDYSFDNSPYSRLNLGLRLGAVYELKGFQLGVGYNLMLTNMAGSDFWETARMPIFNGQVGENNMSGHKHRIHSLEVRLGYFFRY